MFFQETGLPKDRQDGSWLSPLALQSGVKYLTMYDATLPLSPLQRVLDLKPAFKVCDKFKKLEVGSVGSFSPVLQFSLQFTTE